MPQASEQWQKAIEGSVLNCLALPCTIRKGMVGAMQADRVVAENSRDQYRPQKLPGMPQARLKQQRLLRNLLSRLGGRSSGAAQKQRQLMYCAAEICSIAGSFSHHASCMRCCCDLVRLCMLSSNMLQGNAYQFLCSLYAASRSFCTSCMPLCTPQTLTAAKTENTVRSFSTIKQCHNLFGWSMFR